jgi:hypothetical protein
VEQVAAAAVLLPQFEQGLLSGDDVAAVPIDQHDPPEAVEHEVLDHVAQEVEIDAGRGGHRAGKIEMMLRVAQPHERREEHAVLELLRNAADHFAQKQAVGK